MILEEITITLPATDLNFSENLLAFLSGFPSARLGYFPKIRFEFSNEAAPQAIFRTSEGTHAIAIANTTGISKASPHAYSPITFEEFLTRMSGKTLTELDHIGFDLPFFDGIHPEIKNLRNKLKTGAAYFAFPTGEPWDFILPATPDEITGTIDLTQARRPKFEIASIDKTSTPIIQVDFMIRETYEHLVELFPEGIPDPNLKNVWVYITNDFGVDFCFVVGEHQDGDWSAFFEGHRID